MRKLLSFFGSVSMIMLTANLVICCNDKTKTISNVPNSNSNPDSDADVTPDENANNKLLQKRNEQIKIKNLLIKMVDYNALHLNEEIVWTQDTVITFDVIKNALLSFFVDYDIDINEVEIIQFSSTITLPSITSTTITNGWVDIQVKYQGELITEEDQTVFTIEYGSQFLTTAIEILDTLNHGAEVNLANLPIYNQLSYGALTNTLKRIISNNFEEVPTQIPSTFNEDDENWTKWNEWIELLIEDFRRSTLPIDINGVYQKTLGPITNEDGYEISSKIEINYRALLDSLLPTIINLKNYINDQYELGVSDLTLILIKYLFTEPTSYHDDGYADINPNVYLDRSQSKGKYPFANNLEVILHNILEGWSNTEGIFVSTTQPIALSIEVTYGITFNFPFKFQSDSTHWGLKDSITQTNILNFINQLFVINSDQTPQLIGSIKKYFTTHNFAIPLPIKSTLLTEENMFNLLTTIGIDANIKDKLRLTWDHLKVKTFYQTSVDGEWNIATTIEDLKLAINVKFELYDNQITLTSLNGLNVITLLPTQPIEVISDSE